MSLPAVFANHDRDGSLAGRLSGSGPGSWRWRSGRSFPAVACPEPARGPCLGGQSALQGRPAAVHAAGNAAAAAAHSRDSPGSRCKKAKRRSNWPACPDDVFVWDGSSRDRDLAETAALVATLDLVITTDTCIAHLAGAMGKPVWILLPHLADWRWMQETGDHALVSNGAAASAERRRATGLGVVDRVVEELESYQTRTLVGKSSHT